MYLSPNWIGNLFFNDGVNSLFLFKYQQIKCCLFDVRGRMSTRTVQWNGPRCTDIELYVVYIQTMCYDDIESLNVSFWNLRIGGTQLGKAFTLEIPNRLFDSLRCFAVTLKWSWSSSLLVSRWSSVNDSLLTLGGTQLPVHHFSPQ